MSVRVDARGLTELRRDLRSVDKTLPRKLNAEIKRGADPIRSLAATIAPRRTGATAASLKVGVSGSNVRIYSRKSGASAVHWGARHPLFGNRSYWYVQKPNPFITKAADARADDLQHRIANAVESLMRDAGFT